MAYDYDINGRPYIDMENNPGNELRELYYDNENNAIKRGIKFLILDMYALYDYNYDNIPMELLVNKVETLIERKEILVNNISRIDFSIQITIEKVDVEDNECDDDTLSIESAYELTKEIIDINS